MEKAFPIIAAKPATPVPTAGTVLFPGGVAETTHIKNKRYPIMLTTP
jgi:hypothetical protein